MVALSTVSNYPVYKDGYPIVPDVRGMSIRKAKQILIALDEAAKAGRGAAQLNGRMIDAASAKMAENIVNTDNAIHGKV